MAVLANFSKIKLSAKFKIMTFKKGYIIPKQYDLRYKITDSAKETAKLLREQGWSWRAIGREIGCSHMMVKYILFPELYAHNQTLMKQRQKEGRYYDKDKHHLQVKKYLKRKERIIAYLFPRDNA